jgi:hypothetical protein
MLSDLVCRSRTLSGGAAVVRVEAHAILLGFPEPGCCWPNVTGPVTPGSLEPARTLSHVAREEDWRTSAGGRSVRPSSRQCQVAALSLVVGGDDHGLELPGCTTDGRPSRCELHYVGAITVPVGVGDGADWQRRRSVAEAVELMSWRHCRCAGRIQAAVASTTTSSRCCAHHLG